MGSCTIARTGCLDAAGVSKKLADQLAAQRARAVALTHEQPFLDLVPRSIVLRHPRPLNTPSAQRHSS